MKRILVTGAAGFLGHHLVEHIIKNTDWQIVAMVRMGKVGNLRRLADPPSVRAAYWHGRILVVWHDFNSPITDDVHEQVGSVDYIVHAGAETHVDRSINHPRAFVQSNVIGTLNMLEYARDFQPDMEWFHYFSTDEVYGPAPNGVLHTEHEPYNATNPYSASKAGAEQLVNAFGNTYGLPVFTTNTMNLFGERQHKEKFVPLIMRRVLQQQTIYIHADEQKERPGSRFYLHCRNAAAATVFLLQNAAQRERYNIVGHVEVDNLSLAKLVHEYMAQVEKVPDLQAELVDFHSSRPGHDLRYALDGTKLAQMGFEFPARFKESLQKTVHWTMENKEWLGL